MRRTYRYRLYPARAQGAALNTQVDEACRLYNAALDERRSAWRMNGMSLGYYDQAKQLKEIRAAGDIGVANFSACQEVLRRVDKTFAAYFRRVKSGQKAGYPRFRSRSRYDSLTYPSWGDGCTLRTTGRLYLQGVGDLKLKWHRRLPAGAAIKTVTVKREVGRWYVCFSLDMPEAEPLPECGLAVGIDVGLTTFAVLSDGTEIANQRRDFHHKSALALVREYGLIAVEDLNVKGLAGSMLAKSVHDAGWSQFVSILSDKAECAGRTLVKVNPAGTTQRCWACGECVPKTLADRVHACPACGLVVGRDLNAARNVLRLGQGLGWSPQAPTVGVARAVA